MKRAPAIISSVLLIACSGGSEVPTDDHIAVNSPNADSTSLEIDSCELEETYIIDTLEQSIIDAGLVNIQDSIPEILVDLKYSTTDNFMGEDVYGHMARAYLQPIVCASLKKSMKYLKEKDTSLTLLVYDAVRPRRVQQLMWDVVDLPAWEKGKFVSNPANGSLHNYGCAVDLTIAQNDGTPLDMGAGYDDPAKIAYPRYEKAYLDSGMLSTDQVANRDLLRSVMRAGSFWGISTEWWHFNRYNRETAKGMFEILE
jgi:zinc D-Ala-D-Ala dipeptidase